LHRRGRWPPNRRGLIGRTPMRIRNLFTDADGESHFRDIEVEWALAR
jgi:hypothetical protein